MPNSFIIKKQKITLNYVTTEHIIQAEMWLKIKIELTVYCPRSIDLCKFIFVRLNSNLPNEPNLREHTELVNQDPYVKEFNNI